VCRPQDLDNSLQAFAATQGKQLGDDRSDDSINAVKTDTRTAKEKAKDKKSSKAGSTSHTSGGQHAAASALYEISHLGSHSTHAEKGTRDIRAKPPSPANKANIKAGAIKLPAKKPSDLYVGKPIAEIAGSGT